MTKARKTRYADFIRQVVKVYIMLLIAVANLHKRIIKEDRQLR